MEETIETVMPTEMTIEQKVEHMENQLYVLYLQINALTKMLVDKEIIVGDELSAEMELLNKEVYRVTNELIEEAKAKAEAGE